MHGRPHIAIFQAGAISVSQARKWNCRRKIPGSNWKITPPCDKPGPTSRDRIFHPIELRTVVLDVPDLGLAVGFYEKFLVL